MALSTAQAAPKTACEARRLPHGRTLLDITAWELLDPDLTRLIQLGLSGTLRVEIILWQRQRFWFDKNVYSDNRTLTITWSSKIQQPLLDEAPLRNSDPVHLEPIAIRTPYNQPEQEDHYVEISLNLEVVTTDSLTKVMHWMVDRQGEAHKRSAIPQTVLRAVAHDLSREARARCPVKP